MTVVALAHVFRTDTSEILVEALALQGLDTILGMSCTEQVMFADAMSLLGWYDQ